jgi:hypothetical protein
LRHTPGYVGSVRTNVKIVGRILLPTRLIEESNCIGHQYTHVRQALKLTSSPNSVLIEIDRSIGCGNGRVLAHSRIDLVKILDDASAGL